MTLQIDCSCAISHSPQLEEASASAKGGTPIYVAECRVLLSPDVRKAVLDAYGLRVVSFSEFLEEVKDEEEVEIRTHQGSLRALRKLIDQRKARS